MKCSEQTKEHLNVELLILQLQYTVIIVLHYSNYCTEEYWTVITYCNYTIQ